MVNVEPCDDRPNSAIPVRSRRNLLAAAVGGLAASLAAALARPVAADAASGAPLIIGSQANDAGTASTQLMTSSSVVGFEALQKGQATALTGHATATGGSTRGVYGRSDSPNGDGVQARNAGSAGAGAALRAFGGRNDGIVVSTENQTRVGVRVTATDTGGGGAILAETTATAPSLPGAAVKGVSRSLTSNGWGVVGTHDGSGIGAGGSSIYGTGVVGQGGATGVYGSTLAGIGIYGRATSTTEATIGIFATADSANGVALRAVAANGAGIAVDAYGGTSGYAIRTDGDVQVNGTLSKSAGAFLIDHPLDPAHRYLAHSFVESPDMKNLYDGLVILDRMGRAEIELPAWFDALNRDRRYQLTAIGAPAPDLHVVTGSDPNGFRIGGGNPGQSVSWQVTGTRRDPYAEAHRIEVETPKSGPARGRYLHPELYGRSAEERIHPRPAVPDGPAT